MALACAGGENPVRRSGFGRRVRINGARQTSPGRAIKPGDVITVALDGRVRILKIVGFSERRGDAEAGRALYDDLQPPPK